VRQAGELSDQLGGKWGFDCPRTGRVSTRSGTEKQFNCTRRYAVAGRAVPLYCKIISNEICNALID
jgi:hypothetical protein